MLFNNKEEQLVITELISHEAPRAVKKRSFIYTEGETPQGIYFIQSGLVGLIKVNANGVDSLLRVFKPGQFFGHRSFFSNESYHASARALEASEVVFCPENKVKKVFDQMPRAYFFLARALAKELRRAEERSLLISEGEVLERISSTLFLFKKLKPDHNWTRTEIANYCASRTPTVIKVLGELEKQKIIHQDGRNINILDEEALLNKFL